MLRNDGEAQELLQIALSVMADNEATAAQVDVAAQVDAAAQVDDAAQENNEAVGGDEPSGVFCQSGM